MGRSRQIAVMEAESFSLILKCVHWYFIYRSNYFWLYIVSNCNSYFTEIATKFYVSTFSIHWNFWNFLSENEWPAMQQDSRDKCKQTNCPFSRPDTTIKAKVAVSLFLEPNDMALILEKMRHYLLLCYFQNVGLVTKYCAHFELIRCCKWIFKTDCNYLKEWSLGLLTEPLSTKLQAAVLVKHWHTSQPQRESISDFTRGWPRHGPAAAGISSSRRAVSEGKTHLSLQPRAASSSAFT